MPALILDSEALSSLASRQVNAKAARRAQVILTAAHRTGLPVRVPAAILAEVCRGEPRDAAINRVLHQVARIIPTGERIARRAGALLSSRGLSSAHAVDAFVVATTIVSGGGLIATGDPDDITLLATGHPNVKVLPLT